MHQRMFGTLKNRLDPERTFVFQDSKESLSLGNINERKEDIFLIQLRNVKQMGFGLHQHYQHPRDDYENEMMLFYYYHNAIFPLGNCPKLRFPLNVQDIKLTVCFCVLTFGIKQMPVAKRRHKSSKPFSGPHSIVHTPFSNSEYETIHKYLEDVYFLLLLQLICQICQVDECIT